MTFDELAKELDELYTKGYEDREPALREFGTDHEPDLRQMLESGHSLPDLVNAARIGTPEFWAGFIREGMGIAVYLRDR